MDNKIQIVIVEDEALIAQSIKMQLEDFGYQIMDVCYNYNTALKAITEKKFDLLITDINLGNGTDEKSGLQLVAHLQEIKKCPVIFLTAFSDKATIAKATSFKPSSYLIKPCNSNNLYAAVQLAVYNFTNNIVAQNEDKNPSIDYFFVKQGSNLLKIFWKDVYHLEAIKNYVKISTNHIKTGVLLRGSLQSILKTMIPHQFNDSYIQINRAEVIKKDIIIKINNSTVTTAIGDFNLTVNISQKDF